MGVVHLRTASLCRRAALERVHVCTQGAACRAPSSPGWPLALAAGLQGTWTPASSKAARISGASRAVRMPRPSSRDTRLKTGSVTMDREAK